MRNKYAGTCYQCGLAVAVGTGHFERYGNAWRTKHANVAGINGAITCKMAQNKQQKEHHNETEHDIRT